MARLGGDEVTALTARPITAVPITARPITARGLGAGGSLSPEVQAVLARIPNSSALTKAAIATYVDAEVAAGNWQHYDEVWVLSNPHATESLVGLKQFTATPGGAAISYGAEGWGHKVSAWRLETNLDLSTAGLKYKKNDALVSIWEEEGVDTTNRWLFGARNAGALNGSVVRWMNTGRAYTASINSNGTVPDIAPVGAKQQLHKLIQVSRSTSSLLQLSVDGIKEGETTTTSRDLPTGGVQIGGYNEDGTHNNSPAGVMSYVSVGENTGVDKVAQARNVRDLLRRLGLATAYYVAKTPPELVLYNTSLLPTDPVSESGSGTSLGSETSATNGHELVALSDIPGGAPADLAALGVTHALKVWVRSSGNASSFSYYLDFDLSDYGISDIVFSTDTTVASFGLVLYMPDETCYHDRTSSPASNWVRSQNHEMALVAGQDGHPFNANRLQFSPSNGAFAKPGWNYIKLHLDMDNLHTCPNPLGNGGAGGFDYIRMQFSGWRNTSFGGGNPAPVAGEWATFYIAAITKQNVKGSTPTVLFNYDHFIATQKDIVAALHRTYQIPYSVSGTPAVWHPANTGQFGGAAGPENPALDYLGRPRLKVSEMQALINDPTLANQFSHHFGSGTQIPSSYPFQSYANHPSSLFEYVISAPGSMVKADYDACYAAMVAYFTGQPHAVYRTGAYPGGQNLTSSIREAQNAGVKFFRATSLSEVYTRPNSPSPSVPRAWGHNTPELFVCPVSFNTVDIEENPVSNKYLQDAIAHIDAVCARGGMLDLMLHGVIANVKQFNITGLTIGTDTVLCAGHTFSNGDKVMIYDIAGHSTYTSGTGLNCAHYTVRNVAAGSFTLEDIRWGTAVDMAGMPAWTSGGKVTLRAQTESDTTQATMDAVLKYIRSKINAGQLQALTYYDFAHDLGLV